MIKGEGVIKLLEDYENLSGKILEGESSNSKLENMKSDLSELLNSFLKPTNDYVESESTKLLKEYIKKHERILYSEITTFVYKLSNSDKKGEESTQFSTNIESCLSSNFEKNENKKMDETIKILIKIWDHVNLANRQFENLKTSDDYIKQKVDPLVKTNISEIEVKQKELKASVKKTKNDIRDMEKNILTQLISIVGIFVAIAFVMFGGMTLLNNLFDYTGVKGVPIVEMLCLGSLIGLIIIDAIYGFIMMILYLTSKHEELKKDGRLRFVIIILNVILFVIIILTSILWWFDVKNTYGYKENVSGCQVIEVDKNNNKYILECKGEEKLPKCGEIVNENEPTPCE